MRTVAIIQARMTSTRLPGKVLAELAGQPMLAYMLTRVASARRLDGVMVATTVNAEDDPVAALCAEQDVPVFRGNKADVLGRYAGAAEASGAEVVVRLTADCPMIDPVLIDATIERLAHGEIDYVSNAIHLTYPDGLDVEVFTRDALERAHREATLPFHREHVTPYMRTGTYTDIPTGDFRVGHLRAPADFSHLRWTVDTAEDLERVRRLVGALPEGFGWLDAVALLTRRPELLRDDAERAAEAEPAADLALRPATADDAALLLDWVNRPESLANKLATDRPVDRETHEAWLARRLTDPDTAIWIAERAGTPVGQVRLEKRGNALEVDVFVAPEARGAELGVAMLDAAWREAGARWPGVPLIARVKPDNRASRRLFAKASFGETTVAPDHLIFRRASAANGEAA